MKIDDDDKNKKEVKKIEKIDTTKIKKWLIIGKNSTYIGECDQNNKPSGIGRIIDQDWSKFIDGYFKNG